MLHEDNLILRRQRGPRHGTPCEGFLIFRVGPHAEDQIALKTGDWHEQTLH